MIEVVVYSKPACCLCDEVKAQLARLCAIAQFDWREVNILEDAQAFDQFKEEIPVVFINGRKAFKFHLDENEFLRRVEKLLSLERPIENAS
ncbi:MAG TPA: glutaredoxin family protein [Terriglobia bacterium]|nr:glutaredoxin family protein [Terriglobia bacterium]